MRLSSLPKIASAISIRKTPSGWTFQCEAYPDLVDELGGFVRKNAKTVLTAVEELKNWDIVFPKTLFTTVLRM